MRILSYVLTLASSRMGTMALMGSLIFSPSASVPIARSLNRDEHVTVYTEPLEKLQKPFPHLSPAPSPVPRGTACPLFPGNASYSPQPAAGEWSTGTQKADKVALNIYAHKHICTHEPARTLLSSFWYCGIFFSIWDKSLIVVC